jgi:hypothetical protein
VEHGIDDDLASEHFEENAVGEAAKQGSTHPAIDKLIRPRMPTDRGDAVFDRA